MPTVTVADTSGLGLEYYVLDGIDYILGRAQDIAQERECGELPVVINFSSGILAGPRDGTHPLELAIERSDPTPIGANRRAATVRKQSSFPLARKVLTSSE